MSRRHSRCLARLKAVDHASFHDLVRPSIFLIESPSIFTRVLTFCLVAGTAPALMMLDQQRSPFRIGRSIVIADFTPDEATAFVVGFPGASDADACEARALLQSVLNWTAGHPSMTNGLCEILAGSYAKDLNGSPEERVAQVVHELFLQGGPSGNVLLDYANHYLSLLCHTVQPWMPLTDHA